MDLGFRCPLCGSPYFKTIGRFDASPLVRQCRGEWLGRADYTGCDYTWTSNRDHVHGLANLCEPQDFWDPLDLGWIE